LHRIIDLSRGIGGDSIWKFHLGRIVAPQREQSKEVSIRDGQELMLGANARIYPAVEFNVDEWRKPDGTWILAFIDDRFKT
jgi:hypothetical protein